MDKLSLVKEIRVFKGIFSIKSEISNKFSASESYKDQITLGKLPQEAPFTFKEAMPHIYYVPEEEYIISYKKLHNYIDEKKKEKLAQIGVLLPELEKEIQKEVSKEILKEYKINDKTLILYSPILTKKFEEDDEFCKILATYNREEKVIYVTTERLSRSKPCFVVQGEVEKEYLEELESKIEQDLLKYKEAEEDSLSEKFNEPAYKENKEELESKIEQDLLKYKEAEKEILNEKFNEPTYKEDKEKLESKIEQDLLKYKEAEKEEKPKIDIEELKKKYKFQKPTNSDSISDILKGKTSRIKKDEKENIVSVPKDSDPEQELKDFITQCLPIITGRWIDNVFTVNKKESGYLVPIEKIELNEDKIIIKSSPITNTEWWTKITQVEHCPRFKGLLQIDDDFNKYCLNARCSEACQAEDGFVDLSAGRFRLIEDNEIIQNSFKRLQHFLDRAYNLLDEYNSTFEVDIKIDKSSTKPFLYSEISPSSNYNIIRNYIDAYTTVYPELTDIRGKIDIENFELNDDYDPVSEDGLIEESRNYALQEMVKLAAIDMLEDIIRQKDGFKDGKFYLIDKGKLRYILGSNSIEAVKDELYMGTVSFKKGITDVQKFFGITIGGGYW